MIPPRTTQSLVGVEIRGMPYIFSVRVKHGLDVLSNPRVVSPVLAPVPVRAPVPSGVNSMVRIIQHVCLNPLPAARVGRWYPREFSVWGVQSAWWLHHPKSRSDVADGSSPSCLYHVLHTTRHRSAAEASRLSCVTRTPSPQPCDPAVSLSGLSCEESGESEKRGPREWMLHASCGVLHMTPVTRAGGFLKGEPRKKVEETAWQALQQATCTFWNFGCVNKFLTAGTTP